MTTPETTRDTPHLTLVMVMSVNGIVSRAPGESVGVWSSAEDKAHLAHLIETTGAFVTGRRSFNPKRTYKAPVRRYVLTRDAAKAGVAAGPEVFPVAGTAEDVLRRMAADGVGRALLLGGPQVNAMFLEAGAVDEVLLSVEPHLFHKGLPLVTGLSRDVGLSFISAEALNDTGTILLRYGVRKEDVREENAGTNNTGAKNAGTKNA